MGIQWANLWKAFTWLAGTARPRILLTVWEIGLWVIPASLSVGGMGFFGILGSVGGFLVGSGASFLLHELLFIPYGEWVVGISCAPEGAPLGLTPGFISTLERWTGPIV